MIHNEDYQRVKEELQDMVNHPPHYNQDGIECIDAIKAALGDGFGYYLQGNQMKYLWRYRDKNGTEDLKKANWYQQLHIEWREERESKGLSSS